ncbi:Short-chain dehydrogenase/reductase SDR [Penicillium hispanicum]|uniref:Short-chain dehydrogenase/reductase SDR n=1 Tax=Penicillium hispanicum TaxID=1080232 RepID=UPI0025424BF2|nr:Short-chain dehydrogenase/reductase SDR [Penicillium hispanicum]KAJ5584010.1 Short-chain dehydrogenase/reductase SDR [Penicillium hispanicum]
MASFLVTGASRGLGLALVARLASLPATEVGTIFATARQDNSPQLREIVSASAGRVELVKLDVTDKASVHEAASVVQQKLQGKGLDYLINNAGVMDWTATGLEGTDDLTNILDLNVVAVHQTTQAFLPLLRKGEKKVVINISTTLGSIARAKVYEIMLCPAYKVSKAALNMLTVQYAQQYAAEGLSFLAISPGWLRTDLGSENADLPVETGAEKVVDIIQRTGPEQNGKFVNIRVPGWENAPGINQYDGEEIPW